MQSTIFNTAPFWATLLGWFFISEVITPFEIFAMVLSFGGVILIAIGNKSETESDATDLITPVDEQAVVAGFTGSQILGSSLIFVSSWCYAVFSLITRKMQKSHFAVMMFWYSVVAFGVTALIIVAESLIKGQAIRLWAYDGSQWFFTILLSFVNFIGLNC